MKRCLLLCPIGIGNYLLAYPAFYLLKKHFPGTAFYLVVLREGLLSLVGNDPLFAGVISLDPARTRGIRDKVNAVRGIRSLYCDTAIGFFPTNRFEYNALMFLSGARDRFAFDYGTKCLKSARFLCNHLLAVEDGLHDVQQNLRIPKHLGVHENDPPVFPRLFDGDDEAWAGAWVAEKRLANKRLLGIHAGSSADHGMIHKRWTNRNFANLAKQLAAQFGLVPLVFGGPEETLQKRSIAALINNGALMADGLTIRRCAALIARCSMFVSNDSGLMHIAALADVPVAGIFGPTDDTRTAPWGTKHLVIRQHMECCPCWTIANVGKREECMYGDYRCLGTLSVDEVFEKIKTWYEKL